MKKKKDNKTTKQKPSKKKFGEIKKIEPVEMDASKHFVVYAACNTVNPSNPYTTCYDPSCQTASTLC